MSNRKKQLAAVKKASRTARLVPLHALQPAAREAERRERAQVWSKKHKKQESAK